MTNPSDPKPNVTLSPEDAAALDSLLGVPPSGGSANTERTERVKSWLNILNAAPVPQPSSDLLSRTLAAAQAERMKLEPIAAAAAPIQNPKSKFENSHRPWWSRHLADIAAMLVAACLLVAVIIPAVSYARSANRRALCAGNLTYVGNGVGHYATVYNDQLPSLGTTADGNWLNPDIADGGHTNTANLRPLVLATYITPARLICPGRDLPANASATVTPSDIPDCGYSYINLFGPVRPTWDGRHSTIILADRNPLFCSHPATNPELNSPNHARNGNYILRADHSVTWETSPDIGPGKDNIWTINRGSQRLLTYTGTETPTTPGDIFLAP